jgi:hypothetical protein
MSRRDPGRPRCLICGAAIPKLMECWSVSPATANGRQSGDSDYGKRTLYFDSSDPRRPRTLADCQRFTNSRVHRVNGYLAGVVSSFTAWDGESYISPHFCKNSCAERFGRRAAAMGVRI